MALRSPYKPGQVVWNPQPAHILITYDGPRTFSVWRGTKYLGSRATFAAARNLALRMFARNPFSFET